MQEMSFSLIFSRIKSDFSKVSSKQKFEHIHISEIPGKKRLALAFASAS